MLLISISAFPFFPQTVLVLNPGSFSSLNNHIHPPGFNYHLYANDDQTYIAGQYLCCEFQIYNIKLSSLISNLMFQMHDKDMSRLHEAPAYPPIPIKHKHT